VTLSWILGLPLIGALLIFLSPRAKKRLVAGPERFAFDFLLSLKFYLNFDAFDGGFQFEEKLDLGAWLVFTIVWAWTVFPWASSCSRPF